MIELTVTGVDELLEYLDTVKGRLSSSEFWTAELAAMLEEARRFASDISPVVTGSYAGAHRVVTGNMYAELSIDPRARNTVSGDPVTRYAAAVEEKHQVYGRTFSYTRRLVTKHAEVIGSKAIQ